MTNTNSITFDLAWFTILSGYSVSLRRKVCDAVLNYAATGELPSFKGLAKIAFELIANEISKQLTAKAPDTDNQEISEASEISEVSEKSETSEISEISETSETYEASEPSESPDISPTPAQESLSGVGENAGEVSGRNGRVVWTYPRGNRFNGFI